MIDGSVVISPSSLSAAGQDEQPWLVKSSSTARGSAARAATNVVSRRPATRGAGARRRRSILNLHPRPQSEDSPLSEGIVVAPYLAPPQVTRHSLRGERCL